MNYAGNKTESSFLLLIKSTSLANERFHGNTTHKPVNNRRTTSGFWGSDDKNVPSVSLWVKTALSTDSGEIFSRPEIVQHFVFVTSDRDRPGVRCLVAVQTSSFRLTAPLLTRHPARYGTNESAGTGEGENNGSFTACEIRNHKYFHTIESRRRQKCRPTVMP